MKKISTLYKKDPDNLGRVINEVDPSNAWVWDSGIATRKYDGTSCAIIDGKLYKRYDWKNKKKPLPVGAIACQDPDPITHHHPHWVPCDRDHKSNKYAYEAFDKLDDSQRIDGTYELCGKKVQRNPENLDGHFLIPHGADVLSVPDLSFDGLRDYLGSSFDGEGIVFHHEKDGRMCKIRKKDFGIKR